MDTEALRADLLLERAATVARLSGLTRSFEEIVAASRDTNADDEHDPEGHTIAFERSQVDALIRQARGRLDEIDAAVQRLSGGGFGRCERCGEQISAARLEARPSARRCVACAGRG